MDDSEKKKRERLLGETPAWVERMKKNIAEGKQRPLESLPSATAILGISEKCLKPSRQRKKGK